MVRIEDTDRERSEEKYEDDILDSLEWLGIKADEGPREGGPHAPYRQSERLETYAPRLEKLIADGLAFYCFHTEEELDKEKKELMAAGKNPVHECANRAQSPADQQKMLREKTESIIRFKTPPGLTLKFSDLVRGEIAFASGLLGDFSIAKDLETPLYNFAVVVDDAAMQISHVIRGEDHISNTPKQILIQQALGFETPAYAHLPIILGPDRSKLSKRHGATALNEFRALGYLPEAMVNFMALLGWNPGSDRAALEKGKPRPKEREIFSLGELINEFSLDKVQKSGAVFNVDKLDWINGEYIRRKSPAELTTLAAPHFSDFLQFPVPNDQFPLEYLEKAIALEQPRLKKLSEIGEKADYFFRDPEYDPELLRWKGAPAAETKNALERASKIISGIGPSADKGQIEKTFFDAIGAGDKGKLLWPLRVALTGKKASPGPFEIIAVMGRNLVLARIAGAIQKIS